MEKSKYFLSFTDFIRKVEDITTVKVPKGYIAIDAKKDSKKGSKHKKSKQR